MSELHWQHLKMERYKDKQYEERCSKEVTAGNPRGAVNHMNITLNGKGYKKSSLIESAFVSTWVSESLRFFGAFGVFRFWRWNDGCAFFLLRPIVYFFHFNGV